jgi:fructokinase
VIVVCGEALIDLVPSGDGIQPPRPGAVVQHGSSACPATSPNGISRAPVHGCVRSPARRSARRDGADLSLAYFGSEPTMLAVGEVDSDGLAAYRFVIKGTSAPTSRRPWFCPRCLPTSTRYTSARSGLYSNRWRLRSQTSSQRESERRVVMLDPNIRPALVSNAGQYRRRLHAVIARSTIVGGNDADLARLDSDLDLEAAVDRILGAGGRIAVATLGAQGARGASNSVRVSVPAPTLEVVDTIGAGDFLGAALLACLHDHGALGTDVVLGVDELKSALVFACLVASLTCTRAGAEPPWRAELGDDLAGSLGTSYK